MANHPNRARNPVITVALLCRHGACDGQVELFRKTFPKGGTLTLRNLNKAIKAGLQIAWLERFIPSENRAEYERVTAQAWAEYERVKAPALAEYQRVTAQALAEYERVKAQASAEYRRVKAQAWAEYERVTAPAWAEYERVTAQALLKALRGWKGEST